MARQPVLFNRRVGCGTNLIIIWERTGSYVLLHTVFQPMSGLVFCSSFLSTWRGRALQIDHFWGRLILVPFEVWPGILLIYSISDVDSIPHFGDTESQAKIFHDIKGLAACVYMCRCVHWALSGPHVAIFLFFCCSMCSGIMDARYYLDKGIKMGLGTGERPFPFYGDRHLRNESVIDLHNVQLTCHLLFSTHCFQPFSALVSRQRLVERLWQ